MRAVCDHTCAGVLLTGPDGRYLMAARAAWPDGYAPPAGHVFDFDPGGSYPRAIHALAAAQLRASVTGLKETSAGGWRGDRCSRPAGPRGTGHHWRVYTAAVTGTVAPPRAHARRIRWVDARELQELAHRTAQYAHGRVSGSEFFARPGLQPVWVAFLADLGIITMPGPYLAAIDQIARTGGPL